MAGVFPAIFLQKWRKMVKVNKHSVDQCEKTAHFLLKMDIKFGTGIDFSTKCRYTKLIYGMVSLRQNPMGFCFSRVKNKRSSTVFTG